MNTNIQTAADLYEAAFLSCYPQKRLSFAHAGKGKAWVIIDGARGERPLTADEMEDAARQFRR